MAIMKSGKDEESNRGDKQTSITFDVLNSCCGMVDLICDSKKFPSQVRTFKK